MAHLVAGSKTRFEATPPEWLKIGQQFAELANGWARRNDIVAYVGENAGMGVAAACWIPAIAEMEVAVKVAFDEDIEPQWIGDFTDRDVQFDYPAAAGAVLHEAMHARHTRFDLVDLAKLKRDKPHEGYLVEWMEETRIEARGVYHYPMNRAFLRSSALKLSLSDMDAEQAWEKGGVMSFSQLLLLSVARVDAGVLDPSDVEAVKVAAIKLVTEEVYEKLRDIWSRAQSWNKDSDLSGLQKLAREWLDTLKDAGHDAEKEQPKIIIVISGDGEPSEQPAGEDGDGEGDGEGEGESPKQVMSPQAMRKLVEDAADATETKAHAEASGQAVREAGEEAAKAAAAAAKESKEASDAASEVFGRGTGPVNTTMTSSRLYEKRAPKDKERAAAVVVSRMLERARYRDRITTKHRSAAPPGRLNGRGAMQRAVERSRGQMATAEPWKRTQRRHVEDPMLKVGMMTDISGSMSSAMEPMGVVNWVFSEAVRRVQGKVASVFYGNGVFAGLAPGQHLKEVTIYTAPDGTERFDMAFKALNGSLDLLNETGARLLVIVSDLCYTQNERQAARKWIKRCNQAGVAVLILPASDYYSDVNAVTEGLDVQVVSDVSDPAAVAQAIGAAAADALTKAGRRAA